MIDVQKEADELRAKILAAFENGTINAEGGLDIDLSFIEAEIKRILDEATL